MFPKFGFYAGFSPAWKKRRNPVTVEITGFCVAEKEGFEPSRPFRSLHDFQSCALDQLGDFSITNIRCGFYRALIVYHKKCRKSIVLCNFKNLFLYFCAGRVLLTAKICDFYEAVVIFHKNKAIFFLYATESSGHGI